MRYLVTMTFCIGMLEFARVSMSKLGLTSSSSSESVGVRTSGEGLRLRSDPVVSVILILFVRYGEEEAMAALAFRADRSGREKPEG